MADSVSAAHDGGDLARPNLVPLILLILFSCLLSIFFLVDTYGLRKTAPQYLADGRAYILRIAEPSQSSPAIEAQGARLLHVIAQAQEQARTLRAEIAERVAREREFRVAITGLTEQLAQAERLIAELKADVEDLQKSPPGLAEDPSTMDVQRVKTN